ncbi:hypothetical protein LG202_10970 [Methylobacillus methanolivorans]
MLGILHNSETQHTHFDKYSKYEKYDNYKISIGSSIKFFKGRNKKTARIHHPGRFWFASESLAINRI